LKPLVADSFAALRNSADCDTVAPCRFQPPRQNGTDQNRLTGTVLGSLGKKHQVVASRISPHPTSQGAEEMLIEWDASFETGDRKNDDIHQYIVRRLNEIWQKIGGHDDHVEMEKWILEYFNYYIRHFNDEECLMAKVKYPECQKHKKRHLEIIEQFNSILIRLDVVKSIMRDEVRGLIITISDHMKVEDRKLARFVREHRPPQ
jgi:hemerythrin-like metal-binding protein